MKIVASALLVFSLAGAATLSAKTDGGFYATSLPKGKDVTLPPPAITFVPLSDRVTISSTDMPQTLKLSAVNLTKGKPQTFRVAIYDSLSPRVKYITLKPGLSYMYTFKDLNSIAVVPEISQQPRQTTVACADCQLRLESNKALGISR
jgi:hypothetical protein